MYVFKFPAHVPLMTFDSLRDYVARGRSVDEATGLPARKIGATVTVVDLTGESRDPRVEVRLYATRLATVTPHEVRVGHTLNDHVRHATREWLQLILTNNDILGHVGAQGGKYAQTGQTYPVGDRAPRPYYWQEAAPDGAPAGAPRSVARHLDALRRS